MVVASANHKLSEAYVSANVNKTSAVGMEVKRGGLALPRIVGINAIQKTIEPTENTKSCHMALV